MRHEHVIKEIVPGSIAQEMGIEPGDRLLSINDTIIEDVFDYHYCVNEEELVLLIEKPDGEEWELEIEKDYDEDLGIEFEQGLMDEYRSCRNKCMFCFIDQMPAGMRETLYFKDDDSRLSFLQGNYITLTNMNDHDIERIISYHLEPINISFHTTNPELRCKMLHNRFAGDALRKVDRLYEGGITMNGQIVLCKGINDGEELERSIRDMSRYLPHLQSVSVVPVGLTRYRDGLHPLEPFTKEDAREVLETIHRWQDRLYEEYGLHFIHAGTNGMFWQGRTCRKRSGMTAIFSLRTASACCVFLKMSLKRLTRSLKGMDRSGMFLSRQAIWRSRTSGGWQSGLRRNIRARRYMYIRYGMISSGSSSRYPASLPDRI